MALASNALNIAILAVPEVAASTLFGMVDLFASAGRDWAFFLTGVEGEQRLNPYVVGARQDGFAAANGILGATELRAARGSNAGYRLGAGLFWPA